MKISSKIALLVAGAAAFLFARKKGVAGVGAIKKSKRRIWNEIELAQKNGIDLTNPNGWRGRENVLDYIMATNRAIPSASTSAKPIEERYYKQLYRAYKSIAGTTLPYKESVVRNENDDVILIYRDYELDQLPIKAADWVKESIPANNGNELGYWHTLADIATGRVKFIWGSKGEHRGVEKLVFGASAPSERKQRISYIASEGKGGQYPENYAHHIWESVTNGTGDDMEITDGVLEAIRSCSSVKQAQDEIVSLYLREHQVQEPLLYQDVPF